MAKPEQTEKPTAKRVGEARSRGQVARSPDVGGSLIFLAIIITLHTSFVPAFGLAAHSFAVAIQTANGRVPINIHSAWGLFARAFAAYIGLMGVAFGAAVGIAILANVLQFGFLFAPAKIKPKFSTLNPFPGLKRLFFSPQALIQLAKQLAKILLVFIVVFTQLHDQVPMFYQLAHTSPYDLVMWVEGTAYGIGIRFGLLFFCLGMADYFYERHRLTDSLKMTKTEVKDEHRQQEGNPEMRQAVKQRHLMARRIRELAREHNIPIMENPPLARALYDKVELDSPVPPTLYAAVAQVIAFIYKLKNRTIA